MSEAQILKNVGTAMIGAAKSRRAQSVGKTLFILGESLPHDLQLSQITWNALIVLINGDYESGCYGGYLPRQLRKPKVRAALNQVAKRFARNPGEIPAFLERTPSYRLPPPAYKLEWYSLPKAPQAPAATPRPAGQSPRPRASFYLKRA